LHPETKEHNTSNEKVRQNCELNNGETIVAKKNPHIIHKYFATILNKV